MAECVLKIQIQLLLPLSIIQHRLYLVNRFPNCPKVDMTWEFLDCQQTNLGGWVTTCLKWPVFNPLRSIMFLSVGGKTCVLTHGKKHQFSRKSMIALPQVSQLLCWNMFFSCGDQLEIYRKIYSLGYGSPSKPISTSARDDTRYSDCETW